MWALVAVCVAGALGILLFAGPDRGLPSALEPPAASGIDPPIQHPSSELRVPILLSLDALAPGLEERVPLMFGRLDERRELPSIPGLSFAFEAERSEFEVEIRGDTLELATTLAYRGRGWYESGFLPTITGGCPSAGGVRPRMRAAVAVTFTPTPDWRLGPDLELRELRPLTDRAEDRCQVGQMGMELTEGLLGLLREGITSELDRTEAELAEVSVRAEMEEIWSRMGEAVSVGPGLWLLLEPSTLRIGRMSRAPGENSRLLVDAGLTVRPRLIVAPDPPVTAAAPLPPLTTGSGSPGADAVVVGEVGHPLLSALLRDEIVGREFGWMGLAAVVRDVRSWGLVDGRGVVELEVDGPVRSRVWLVGRPDLDREGETVGVADLEMYLSSRNVLLRAVNGLFGGMLVRRIQREAALETDDLVPSEGVAGFGPLARELAPGVILQGELGLGEIEGIRVTPAGVHIRSRVVSALTLHVYD